VKADDADAGDNGKIKYSLDFGNDDGFFSVEETSGNVTLVKLVPLQENQISRFPLYVTARDGKAPREPGVKVEVDRRSGRGISRAVAALVVGTTVKGFFIFYFLVSCS